MYTAMALGIKKIILGIEANKPLAIKAFERFSDLDVVVLKKQYPMGSEKHLIYCTTGRKVPTGKMPFDVGCCVQNIKLSVSKDSMASCSSLKNAWKQWENRLYPIGPAATTKHTISTLHRMQSK